MDQEGVIPDALDEMMESWDVSVRGGSRPKMLVVVPWVDLKHMGGRKAD
jgi:DNA-binding transcriptional MocR family regulator